MTWGLALDLLGTFFFAISGSLLAAKRGFDIVASLLLGSLTGLGGGGVRDLIIGRPPAAFDERERQHADWAATNTPWNAVEIVDNHIRIIRKVLEDLSPGPFRDQLEQGIRNTTRIAAGELGTFGPPRCLDQIAFREYLRLVDLRSSPQEFLAYVFERGGRSVNT